MQGISIRPMVADDIAITTSLVVGTGRRDRTDLLQFFVGAGSAASFPVIAEDGGGRVGQNAGSKHGSVGWLCLLNVATGQPPALAGALLDHSIAQLEAAGCTTIVACVDVKNWPLIEARGFEYHTTYLAYEHRPPFAFALPAGSTMRQLVPGDLAGVQGLDQAASGEDRTHLLQTWIALGNSWGVFDSASTGLLAFWAPCGWGAPGAGPIILADPASGAKTEHALALIAQQPATQRYINAVVTEDNAAGIAALEANGFVLRAGFARVIRGSIINWHPERIFGIHGIALG